MKKREADLYVKLNSFKYREKRTLQFIRKSLDKVDRPYLSCSFGKDSSVMLHLVLRCVDNIEVKFLGKKETPLIDSYDEVIEWWEYTFGIEVEKIIYTSWLENDPSAMTGIAANVTDDENDAYFVGIRAQESSGRRISLKKLGEFTVLKNGKARIAPMAWWKTRDIAAYMVHHELPVLQAYAKEGFSARTTTNIPSPFPHESIARLKEQDPENYNKLINLYPDAKYFT